MQQIRACSGRSAVDIGPGRSVTRGIQRQGQPESPWGIDGSAFSVRSARIRCLLDYAKAAHNGDRLVANNSGGLKQSLRDNSDSLPSLYPKHGY
jgi:hypothetical protein